MRVRREARGAPLTGCLTGGPGAGHEDARAQLCASPGPDRQAERLLTGAEQKGQASLYWVSQREMHSEWKACRQGS